MQLVAVVSSAEEALEKMKGLVFDLILLDINMPGMDGLSFLDHVMHNCPIPVIIFSSQVNKGSEVVENAMARGAAACFDKAKITTRMAEDFIILINKIHAEREVHCRSWQLREKTE